MAEGYGHLWGEIRDVDALKRIWIFLPVPRLPRQMIADVPMIPEDQQVVFPVDGLQRDRYAGIQDHVPHHLLFDLVELYQRQGQEVVGGDEEVGEATDGVGDQSLKQNSSYSVAEQ